MNNEFQFALYDPMTNQVIVNIDVNVSLVFDCRKYNSNVFFEEDFEEAYLLRLAEDSPLLYAELALKKDGLQDYVDTVREFN